MRKFNKTIILLILVGLVAFVLGSKSTTEPTKWEYATYWRANLEKFDINSWRTPDSHISGTGVKEICQKLNVTDEKDKYTIHVLFNYAGAQGWELFALNDDKEAKSTVYWFKRPKGD